VPGRDSTHFEKLLLRIPKSITVKALLADAGYDSEKNHKLARETFGIDSIIFPGSGRKTKTNKLPKGKYRRIMKTRFDKNNELTIVSIGALDQFKLNLGIENPTEDQEYILTFLPVNEQWSYAIGAVYKHFKPNSFQTLVVSRNMLNNTSYKYPDNDETRPPTPKVNLSITGCFSSLSYKNSPLIITGTSPASIA